MKIGIMTFVHTSNYGAALQAYALQKVISQQCNDCDIIDYDAEFLKQNHDPKQVFKRKGIAQKLVAPMMYRVYSKRLKAFEQFAEKYCRMSKKTYNASDVSEIENEYDRIVVGSDQVWNSDILNNDESFFLNFIEDSGKKCSYAASMGSEYFPEKFAARFEKYIKDFSVISVREQTGQAILKEHINKDVSCDVDPTLLLEPEKWDSFISDRPYKKDYILVYMIPENNGIYNRIRELAKKENCDILWVRKGIKKISGFHNLNTISPEEFLNYVYHAKSVVAGSFHAICFSLIYQKEFFYTVASVANRSVRLLDLLAKVEIKDRNLMDEKCNLQPIDYSAVNEILGQMRNESMKTINKICNK
ncbi:MAG: polysaccharide pyruvyl transferase family protein [Acutalibacteraceae bacterium]